jgi:hypothetical protein
MTHDPDNHGWIELPANIIATNHHPQFMCYSRASILAPPNTPPLMLHMGVNENGVCFQDTRCRSAARPELRVLDDHRF